MNLFDLVLLGLGAAAALAGYRLGLLARALSWAGLALGLFFATRFLPSVVERLQTSGPGSRLLVALAVLLGGAFLGQALGLVVGSRAQVALPKAGRSLDRLAGGITGVMGVVVAVWLLLPTLAEVPGIVARQARTSRIGRVVNDVAPAPPDPLQTLRRLVGEGTFPQVFSNLRPAPDLGPPPVGTGLSASLSSTVAASTVRVEGPACGRLQEGSGFVVAPGVVVTNAHVVAGEDETALVLVDGQRVDAVVVAFDPDRDLAVLAAPGLQAAPLPVGSIGADQQGAVFGYPGGGPLQLSPFAVSEETAAIGRDLYDEEDTRRSVLVLAADLAPGDSGAALVDPTGSVVGVAFAISPDLQNTAYALAVSELEAVLAAPRSTTTDTGPCLA